MLAELLAAALLAHELHQQPGMAPHHGGHLSEQWKRWCGTVGEGGGELAEQPGSAKASAPDDDAGAAGLLHHCKGVGGLPDVAVAEHGNVDVLDELGDRVPVSRPGVVLRGGASVQPDRGAA